MHIMICGMLQYKTQYQIGYDWLICRINLVLITIIFIKYFYKTQIFQNSCTLSKQQQSQNVQNHC